MPAKNDRLWTYSLPAALLLLAPFNILASLGMDIYLPVVPMMPAILGTTPDIIQLTLSLYMVMLGVGQILFGALSDHIGRRPVLVGGVVLFAMASFGLAFSKSALLFVLLRLVQATGASAMLVAMFATIRDVYADKPESNSIYGLMNAMLAFVPAIGPVVGALLVAHFGWPSVFIALAVPALVLGVIARALWPETRDSASLTERPDYRRLLRNRPFWSYTLAFGTAMGAFFVFFSIAPVLLVDKAGYSGLGFSLAFASVALVMIAATKLVQSHILLWGNRASVVRGMALMAVGALLLAAGQLFMRPSFWSFIVPMWVVALGIVITASVTANGALKDFGAMAGAAVALHFCFQSLIVGLVGTGAIMLFGHDKAWPLIVYIGVMASATLYAMFRLKETDTG